MPKKHSQYSIRYAGLPDGNHLFNFSLNKDFFTSYYSETEVLDAKIEAKINANRGETMMIVDLNLKGSVTVECDRCLDPCSIEIETTQKLIFSSSINETGAKEESDDETIVEISEDTDFIDIESYLYDFSILAIPIRRVHDEKEGKDSNCNQEIIKKITNLSKKNQENNSQWEKLKEINILNN